MFDFDHLPKSERSFSGLPGESAGRGLLPLLAWLSRYFAEQHIQSYVVGGLLRDLLLKRETADIDIAVKANAAEVALQVATALNGRFVLLDEANRIARVVIPGNGVPAEDRWDFTDVVAADGNGAKPDIRHVAAHQLGVTGLTALADVDLATLGDV